MLTRFKNATHDIFKRVTIKDTIQEKLLGMHVRNNFIF